MSKTHHPFNLPVLAAVVCLIALGILRPAIPITPRQPTPALPDTTALEGIDVSHFQGRVNWPEAARAGIAFAYAKATEGVTYVDPKYATNQAAATAAGIPVGAYHFYRPGRDPIAQARHFVATANVGAGSLPPVIDVEIQPPAGVDLATDVQVWITYVAQKTGCVPIIYTNKSLWRTHLADRFTDQKIWLAAYSHTPQTPPTSAPWRIWQYTEKGTVAGITGTVDRDRLAGGQPALQQLRCGD